MRLDSLNGTDTQVWQTFINSLYLSPQDITVKSISMKKVRLFNYHNNGNNSKVNVYFEDGTEWHRTVESYDVQQLAHQGETYLEILLKKYKDHQPKQEFQKVYVNKQFETL